MKVKKNTEIYYRIRNEVGQVIRHIPEAGYAWCTEINKTFLFDDQKEAEQLADNLSKWNPNTVVVVEKLVVNVEEIGTVCG